MDSLPLTNPEQFRQPVIDQRRKHRSGEESSTMDANVPEIKKENVSVKNDIKVSNENVSDHNIKPEEPTEDHDKNISLNCKIDGDVHCPAITEISVDEEKAELSQSKAESKSDVVATDIKQLPTGYCRLLGRLVMVDMPLTAKDCIGSPTHGSSTPIVKSPSLLSRRRFTPALVVLPSAMPSIDLGNTSKSIGSDGVNEDDVKTPSYKLLVRSFKDNKFFAVSVAFVRRLKRSDAVEISHSHPTLRSAFERALLWLDRCELPISWGENSIELMLGTKDWRSLKRRCKLTGSDFSDSTILSPPNLKHSRVSSPASSEASHTANNCRENFQKSSGTRSVNKSDKAARKRPRLSDKTQSPRSSCRLKVKRLKTQILRSDTTGDNQSDDASSNEFSKRSTATKHENAKENMKSQKSDDDSSDSTSSDEGTSSNSVESDTSDTRSLSSLVSSSTNKSSSSVSSTISSLSSSSSSITSSCSTGSTSSSSSTNNSTSSSINSSSSTTASCASPDRSSTSSVAGFEARDRWIAQLYRFMDERGTPINKAPSLANKDLDLYKLYKLVQKLGGFHRVTSQLKWGYVYSKMDLPQNVSGGPRNLQAAFKKPISSASSNSSSKSAFRKRSYDSTMTDIPLINFGRECIGAMGDLSNRIIPVRSRVRVRCGDHVAYEAKVLKHIRPQPSICSRKTDSADGSSTIPTSAAAVWAGVGDIQYRVHYMGWNTRHDEVVPRSRIISVIEWGRGVDEGRPPSCSSLSPIVHEPRKGNTIKIRNESLSKDICTKLSSSTDIKVAEKESADKEAQDESTLEDDNEHEDDDSNQSQTTETASDNITTTAPIIRRRRLMFSSHKPGRQISSRKPSSLSKRNESSSQRLSKLPLLSRFHLPKTHRHVTKTNISEESKQLNTDSIVKKAKTTSRKSFCVYILLHIENEFS
ncbi:unnamed protein product [Trichobilharzia regenti]|nr:unnamed protein product [Trichobilharzia regenti]